MKKIGKYFIITLLLLLGLCCVGLLYLFFIPNASLFGITYISYNQKRSTEVYNASEISSIVLNSRSYDVVVSKAGNNEVSCSVLNNTFGYVLTRNSKVNINMELKAGELTITVSEPHGFALNNNSKIELFIPTSADLDLELNNKNANTKINMAESKIRNFKYFTQNGDLKLESGEITGELNLDLNNSTCNIMKSFKTNTNNLSLKLTTGKLSAKETSLNTVSVLENKRGVIELGNCNRVLENIKAAGGKISANEVGSVSIKTSDSKISIQKISSGADIDLTGMGNVSIGELNGYSAISTVDGKISITSAKSKLMMVSKNGDISVASASELVSANSNYGNISITFSEDAPDYDPQEGESDTTFNSSRNVIAETKNGTITITGADSVDISIKSRGSGSAFVNFHKIIGVSTISGQSGNVRATMDKSLEFKLVTNSENGSVRVNLTQIPQYGGYTTREETTTFVNTTNQDISNILNISSTSGSIVVLDSNFA